MCQRHPHRVAVALRVEVLFRDAQFAFQFVGQVLLEGHLIGILNVFRLGVRFSVEINRVVLDLQRLSRQSHAALHVVLAAVGGAARYFAELLGVLAYIGCAGGVHIIIYTLLLLVACLWQERGSGGNDDGLRENRRSVCRLRAQQLVANLIGEAVVVLILLRERHGVAGGIVEHHDVVHFHIAQSLHAAVVPVRVLEIAFAVDDRQRVLRHGHRERRLRNARAVGQFAHEQVVAREQRLFER